MKRAVEVLLRVAAIDGRLGVAGDKLRMLLPNDCASDLKDAIRQHKSVLLEVLQLTFVVVQSGALSATVFFVPDEATKEKLVTAGAEQGSIYSAAELEELIRCRVTGAELPLIHSAKHEFNGQVMRCAPNAAALQN
jgi:hypothetical protein